MTDDIQTESYPLYEEEEAGLGLMVAEPPYRELSSLHTLSPMYNLNSATNCAILY